MPHHTPRRTKNVTPENVHHQRVNYILFDPIEYLFFIYSLFIQFRCFNLIKCFYEYLILHIISKLLLQFKKSFVLQSVKNMSNSTRKLLNQFTIYMYPHAGNRFVKFTENSVLIFTTWLFSRFHKKISAISRFSQRST